MTLGLLGAVGDGLSAPLAVFFVSLYINKIGRAGASDLDARNFHNDNGLLCIFLYLACASWFACFLEGYCWTRTAERQATRMRSKYMKAVLHQDVGYFDLHVTSTSEVLTSISNDIQIIQDVLSQKVPDCLSKVSSFIAGYLIAFVMMWDLAIVGLPLALLLILPGWICGRSLTGLARKRREECIKAGSIAEQAISSIRTVYAVTGENNTIYQFSEALRGTIKLGLKQGMIKGLAIGSSTGTAFANWAVMSYYGSRKVISHGALGGAISAVGQLMVHGGAEMGAALSNLKYLAEACSAGDHILEIINRVPEIDLDNMEGAILEHVTSKVEFNHVKFAYPSRPESIILNRFCLTVPAGKTVALVGSSGSGKSTVISLLQRFYDPLEGEILLNGVAIDKLQLKWLRSQMASVSQEPSLFSTTIKDNILLGKEDGTREEIVEAAKASNAHDFICQLPQGYDTQVGERGSQVSGGQKQRIAIARALIKKPHILLLDEATSALDSESERLVQEALHRAAMGRTTIVIAHRLSTIRNADLIGVMQNGCVIETGSHDELIQHQNGLYTSFVRLQQTETPEDQFQCTGASTTTLPVIVSPLNLTSLLGGSDSTTAKEYPNNMVTRKSSIWRLLSITSPEWKQANLGCLSAIIFGAVQPLYGLTMGTTLSVLFSTNHYEIKERIRILAFCFLGLSLFALLINIIQHYNFTYMGEYLTNRIRETLLSKMLTFEVAWFDEVPNSSGAICAQLTKDAELVRSFAGDRMGLLVQTISAVTVAWAMGLIIAWRLAILIIAVQPIVILSLYAKRVLLKRISIRATKAQEESCKLAAEAIYNHRTVTAFSAQNRILKMLDKAQGTPRRENLRQSWFAGIGLGFAESITVINWGLSYWYGSRLVHQGYLTPRSVFETILILVSTGRVIANAGSMTSDLAMGLDAITSIFSILDRTTRIEPRAPEEAQVEKTTGHVQFRT